MSLPPAHRATGPRSHQAAGRRDAVTDRAVVRPATQAHTTVDGGRTAGHSQAVNRRQLEIVVVIAMAVVVVAVGAWVVFALTHLGPGSAPGSP